MLAERRSSALRGQAGVQVHVGDAQPGDLRDPQPSLDGQRQQGAVAAAGPAGQVRGGQQRVGLLGGEERHDGPLGARVSQGSFSVSVMAGDALGTAAMDARRSGRGGLRRSAVPPSASALRAETSAVKATI
jgi:hypothetical protein